MKSRFNWFSYKSFIIFFLLGISVGCSDSEKIPVAPNKETASILLSETKKLDRYLGLAVIAATPPKIGGNPFSLEDTQKRVREINKEMEFLEKGKEAGSSITKAQRSLANYINTNDPKKWERSWKSLSHGIEGYSTFSRSDLWNDLVPRKESTKVISQLDNLKVVMSDIRESQ